MQHSARVGRLYLQVHQREGRHREQQRSGQLRGAGNYEISATKLFRGKFARNLSIPFKLISSINQAKKVLKEINPDLVVSKGGYVSLPVCIAARKLRIPIISHESDYSFGLANKIILKVSNVMCVNFEHLTNVRDNIVYTGPIISNSFKLTNIKSDINFN